MKDSKPERFNRKSDAIGVSNSAEMKRRRFQKTKSKGRGFLLERANSNPNFYNPALIKKRKEFYKNAKLVNKFRKTIKRESQDDEFSRVRMSEFSRVGTSEEDHNQPENTSYGHEMISKKTKNKVRKEKLEEEEKERKEKELHFKAKKEKIEDVEARRKAIKEKMMKRSRKGQPVMKYRIERILETIEGSQKKI